MSGLESLSQYIRWNTYWFKLHIHTQHGGIMILLTAYEMKVVETKISCFTFLEVLEPIYASNSLRCQV
jgi:hypothetical protein